MVSESARLASLEPVVVFVEIESFDVFDVRVFEICAGGVGASEIAIAETGVFEIGVLAVGVIEFDTEEVAVFEIGAREVSLVEMAAVEAPAFGVGSVEIDVSQIADGEVNALPTCAVHVSACEVSIGEDTIIKIDAIGTAEPETGSIANGGEGNRIMQDGRLEIRSIEETVTEDGVGKVGFLELNIR